MTKTICEVFARRRIKSIATKGKWKMAGYFAQYGEDRILATIFPDSKGCCVEVGAFDGRTGSNTLYFEQRGWHCILVEPNPVLAQEIQKFRTANVFCCAVGSEAGTVILQIPKGAETLSSVSEELSHIDRIGSANYDVEKVEVPQRTLNAVLMEANVSKVEFMTIDVEGYEMDVLRGFDLERWAPRIVIMEDNSSGTEWSVPVYFDRHGYIRFRSSGCNDWYCRLTDPLATRRAVFITESLKAMKGIKRVVTGWVRRGLVRPIARI